MRVYYLKWPFHMQFVFKEVFGHIFQQLHQSPLDFQTNHVG